MSFGGDPFTAPGSVGGGSSDGAGGSGWVPVSPRLATARRITLLLGYLLVIAGGVGIAISPLAIGWLVAYAVVALTALVWIWWIIGRRVR
ncbi:MAG: hypothetical protein ACO21P_01335, partial [Candidatus Nanopelagicales bacterium]